MELTEDKDWELQEGYLYMCVVETSCSVTREFFGGRKLPRPFFCTMIAAARRHREITNIRDMIVSRTRFSPYLETPQI